MSNSAISKAKRIFAALLVGVFISGAVPFSPLVGITPQPMVVKASSDDITRLNQDGAGGYYDYLPNQGFVEWVDHAVNVDPAEGGTVAVSDNITSAKKDQVITVTATPDHENGFVLAGLRVVDEDGNNIKVESGNWYAGNTATFIMPDKAVSIQADFTNNLTAEGGLSVDMPYSGKLFVNVPSEVISFKVIDDGKNNLSSNGYVVINAPENCRVMVSGTVTSKEDYSYFSVADNTGVGDEVSGNDFFSTSDANKNIFCYIRHKQNLYSQRRYTCS